MLLLVNKLLQSTAVYALRQVSCIQQNLTEFCV